MEQYHPDAYVGKPKRAGRQQTADKAASGDASDGDQKRYAEINRAVTKEEVSFVRNAAEQAGLWRFCDPPRHDGFSL